MTMELENDQEIEVIYETEYVYLESDADYSEILQAIEDATLAHLEYWDKNMQSLENAIAIQIIVLAAILGALVATIIINQFSRR